MRYYVFVESSFKHTREECESKRVYVFVCCSVNVSVCFVCCVFVNCLVKQFAMCLGVVTNLLLNIINVFSV